MKNQQLVKIQNPYKALLPALLIFGSLLLCNVASARVLSLGAVETITQNDGSSFQQMLVQCSSGNTRPILIKQANGNLWCDSVISNTCNRNKINAASKVCTPSYAIAIKEIQEKINHSTTQVSEQEKTKTEFELQEELIEIQQSLLDIKGAYVKLQKKEMMIRNQSGFTASSDQISEVSE